MSSNRPTSNPYTGRFAQAYAMGWNHGHGIACHNVPKIGQTIYTDCDGRMTIDAENIRDAHRALCFEAESNSRSYSPFEFTAHEFNESDDPDGLWEAFEEGTTDAIMADLAEYTDDDYNIEQ